MIGCWWFLDTVIISWLIESRRWIRHLLPHCCCCQQIKVKNSLSSLLVCVCSRIDNRVVHSPLLFTLVSIVSLWWYCAICSFFFFCSTLPWQSTNKKKPTGCRPFEYGPIIESLRMCLPNITQSKSDQPTEILISRFTTPTQCTGAKRTHNKYNTYTNTGRG